jgi:hypothetical protein
MKQKGAEMTPEFSRGNVKAICLACSVPVTFEYKDSAAGEFGTVILHQQRVGPDHRTFARVIHKLLRCAVCSSPGVATVLANQYYEQESVMLSFWPTFVVPPPLPSGVPEGVEEEFEEAVRCMSAEAWRGAAGLIRSALEKVLKANGYDERDLFKKIEAAGADGLITSSRRQRAQDLVRTLGNDVLHDEWRPVSSEEVDDALHYVGRVIDDFYDDRPTVESVLSVKGRTFIKVGG